MDPVIALAALIALPGLITLAAVYAVVIWIDKPTSPGRPPSALVALHIWNARQRAALLTRQRFAPRWRKGTNENDPPVHPRRAVS
jgi:hypothetical protein